MSAAELSKRERRLRAAVARAEARALELWPDEGSEGTRRRRMVKRKAFVQGAMFWRYAEQVHAVEGAVARRRQSEADKASSTDRYPDCPSHPHNWVDCPAPWIADHDPKRPGEGIDRDVRLDHAVREVGH